MIATLKLEQAKVSKKTSEGLKQKQAESLKQKQLEGLDQTCVSFCLRPSFFFDTTAGVTFYLSPEDP